MAATAEGQSEYETLVRQQLTELGYDANAIPDEVRSRQATAAPLPRQKKLRDDMSRWRAQVLREFLQDFEEKMELGDGTEDAAQLSYPTALNSAEARSVGSPAAKKAATPTKGGGKAGGASRPASKAAPKSTRPASSRGPSGLPAAKASLLTEMPPANPVEASDAEQPDEYAAAVDVSEDMDDGAGGTGVVPRFTPAQWDALRPAASPRKPASRPQSARVASSPRGGLGSSSGLAPHSARASIDNRPPLGSMSGVIHSQSMITTPKRPKSDPVSLHARRQAQWRSDSYLSLTTKRTAPPIDMSPAPRTVQMAKRKVNTYVVPTSKRRDDLVWQTRQRLRNADIDAGGVGARAPSKRMVPNSFVPATEKRRDDLRWHVRAEMATRG